MDCYLRDNSITYISYAPHTVRWGSWIVFIIILEVSFIAGAAWGVCQFVHCRGPFKAITDLQCILYLVLSAFQISSGQAILYACLEKKNEKKCVAIVFLPNDLLKI